MEDARLVTFPLHIYMQKSKEKHIMKPKCANVMQHFFFLTNPGRAGAGETLAFFPELRVLA